jgi:flagellar basal-body rod modification protein FlgD
MSSIVETSSIPTTTSTTTTSSSSSSATGAMTDGINMGKDDFLLLLTTQLRYQDPMSPADPKDFVAQLAQFSSLEQLINVNTKMDDFSTTAQSLQKSQDMAQGVSLLGKTVKAQGNSFTVSSGTTTPGTVILGADAKSVKVSIYNAGGTLVRTLDLGSHSSGEVQVAWDGKDSNGNTMADGSYTFDVTATDAKGNTVDAATYFTGQVEEVLQDGSTVYVKVNGRLLPLSNVFAIDQSS